MPDAHTTFLPKTNGMVFADRLVARSDKGRVFGLGHSAVPIAVAEGQGANWVSTNVYEVGQTVEGKTAAFTGGVEPVDYRYRFQFKPTGSPDWVIPGWTNTTNAKNSVTYVLTEPGQVKLQSQARGADGNQLNSTTGIKTVASPPLVITGNVFWDEGNTYNVGDTVTAHTSTFSGGVVPVSYEYRWEYTQAVGFDGETREFFSPFVQYDNTRQLPTLTLDAAYATILFEARATDSDGVVVKSRTSAKTVTAPPPPEAP